jgi:nucleosome binding factor SPN SPT16 subunit
VNICIINVELSGDIICGYKIFIINVQYYNKYGEKEGGGRRETKRETKRDKGETKEREREERERKLD